MRWLRDRICRLTCKFPGLGGYSLWGVFNHPLDACFLHYYRRTKWFIQRGWRGYADCDGWSIDGYLNSWMPRAIRGLKTGYGYPVQLYCEMYPDEDWTKMNPVHPVHSVLAHARWHEILEKIAQGFEAGQKIGGYEFEGAEQLMTLQTQLNDGLALFRHYYQNLWD